MQELNALYTHVSHFGWGIAAQELATALHKNPYTNVYDAMPMGESVPRRIQGEREAICSKVLWMTLPCFLPGWWENQTPYLLTMWETTHVPEGFGNFTSYEKLFLPSDWCMEQFAGKNPNIVKVPLGVNPIEWQHRHRPEPTDFFEFLTCGSSERKGITLACEAFIAAFPDKWWGDAPPPRLTVKSISDRQPVIDHRYIRRIVGCLDRDTEVTLYAQSHCGVFPARGEGWGMQPLQAIAQGLPTILTDAHSHTEFSKYGLPISAKQVPVPPGLITAFGRDVGDWFEPDFDELVDRMRWVYDNYSFERDNAIKQSSLVLKSLTWANSAKRLAEEIGESTVLESPGEWLSAQQLLVSMIPTWTGSSSIGGVKYQFQAGVPVDVPPAVHNIMEKAGYVASS